MKNLNFIIKKFFLVFIFLLSFTSFIQAVEVANDQFANGLDGYTGNGVTWYSNEGGWMDIERDETAKKVYDFGSSYANTNVTISFRIWANDRWDSSDRFEVKVNGSTLGSYQIDNGGIRIETISAITDANGKLELEFKPNTNRDDEFGSVDYVIINALTPTVWIKNAAGTSAYTSPTPYGDNVDITETLTSPTNSTTISVTVSGDTESNYDYIYITDSAGNTVQYDGTISDTYEAAGPSVTIRFTSDINTQPANGGVTVSITDIIVAAQANPDFYTTQPDTQLVVNAIDGLLGNDTGLNITITSTDLSSLEGNIAIDTSTGAFTYDPPSGFTGSSSFTYTITDDSGTSSSATVTINVVVDTDYDTNFGFELINPESTRNIIGGYEIAGNTVLCLTSLTSGYATSESECLDTTSPGTRTSNNYVAKFIDIDGDNSTWNSSSSNITLPASYDQQGGNGILWAGLIWQGRFVWDGTRQNLHYHRENGSTFTTIETGSDTNLDNVSLADINAPQIRLKIDNGSYTQVQAYKVYSDDTSGGTTYTSIANVTSVLRNANLAIGKHTFTVANLPTEEGRENTPGIYGGWVLAVIYAEDPLVGSPRNISIYGGMDELVSASDPNNTPIEISGFKLPSSGNTVTSQLSIFSGEGELPYTTDGVQISDTVDSGYVNMPTSSSATNIFDAIMNDIDRDNITGHMNNLQNNNVGVDVDNFDLSAIVSGYSRDITSLFIKWYSENDYIIPGMIAFSTELYQPNICYDYTLDIEGYVIPSTDNIVQTPYGSYGDKKMTTRVSIKSLEGDFALSDVNITYRIANTNHLQYITDSTAIAPNGIYNYIPAGTTGLNQTYNQTNEGFGMYIGSGAGTVPTGPGGVIDSYETRYFRFMDDMKTSTIDTSFDLILQYNVDYGSGPLTLTKILQGEDICQDSGGYYPAPGIFNTTSTYAPRDVGKPFNLYTQISERDFDVRVFSYDPTDTTYSTLQESNATIEIEVFNAGFFARDVNLSCFNPDSNISQPQFVNFYHDGTKNKYVDLLGLNYDFAIRNAGFRTWHLVDPDTKLVYHDCTSRTDETCFHDLYTGYYASSDGNCTTQCSSGGTGCYACLRSFYGKPICSRDNFSIRPEAFVTQASDSNQSTNALNDKNTFAHSRTNSPLVDDNGVTITNVANLVAGYNYRFDVNATSNADDFAVRGYIQSFSGNSVNSKSTMVWAPPGTQDVTNCNDVTDDNISIVLFHGKNVYNNIAQVGNVNQIGIYKFQISDSNWTAVDWYPGLTTHHAANGFETSSDCLVNDNIVDNVQRQGCDINSTHLNNRTNVQYTDLDLEFFPHSFNVASLSAGSPMVDTLGNGFVYINTLDVLLYPDGIDENMSYNIQGTFSARGWASTPGQGTLVTNFVDKCYASNVDMNLTFIYLSAIPGTTANFTRDIIDMNTVSGGYTRTRERNITAVSGTLTQNTLHTLLVSGSPLQQKANYFAQDMTGSLDMDLGLNFDRTNDVPLNPRSIQFQDFNLTYASNPRIYVDMDTNYKISGNLNINQNVTFLYGRAKPSKTFYDDVSSANIDTPISVVNYCDLGYTECQNRGIKALIAQTNEFNWWKSTDHNSTALGRIELLSSPATALNTTTVNILGGIDQTINVNNGGVTPLTVPINLVVDDLANPGPAQFTDRWLIFNLDDPVLPPVPFYRVRFIGNSGWVGYGDTGHVVGGTVNEKKNRRLEW